jgi:hypothetical protein
MLNHDSKAPERKKCSPCNAKSKVPEISLVDDEEFENIDPKDSRFQNSSKNCCKEDFQDEILDLKTPVPEPTPLAVRQNPLSTIGGFAPKMIYELPKQNKLNADGKWSNLLRDENNLMSNRDFTKAVEFGDFQTYQKKREVITSP